MRGGCNVQQTIDNRAAAAEALILELEGKGYHFGFGKSGLLCSEEIKNRIKPYKKEIAAYISSQGAANARRCKEIALGGRGD
jgi:hypothetical protein